MRWVVGLVMSLLASAAFAAEAPVEIDPNTKTQGGADLRGSDSAAGASGEKVHREKPRVDERGNVVVPDKEENEKDKPISARKPRDERDREATKGDGSQ